MLSTEYRLRLEFICNKIAKGEEVQLSDMIWADKLAKANRSAGEMLRKAREEHARYIAETARLASVALARSQSGNRKVGADLRG